MGDLHPQESKTEAAQADNASVSSKAAARRSFIVGGMMAAGAGLAYLATPRSGEGAPRPDLAKNVPAAFGPWTTDLSVAPVLPDEATQATLDKFYDETLSRTYRNDQGQSVMFVVAYGARQTEALQAHQPEVCYAAQGFHVEERGDDTFKPPLAAITAKRVYAALGARTEPILYWLCVDGEVTNFGLKLRWRQIRKGLEGHIPEGFLVRASLIGEDRSDSYEQLETFLAALLGALPADLRQRLAGV